jgi:hypothetical protein
VLASRYQEVVVDRLFDGKTQLTRALQPLMLAAEKTLHWDEDKRSRTIVRVDAGGGSLDDVNWLLVRGYQVQGKDYAGQQAKRLASTVEYWFTDPQQPERQFGWVTEVSRAYVRPVKRIAVRCRKPDGQFAYGVLIAPLSAQHVLVLTGQPLSVLEDRQCCWPMSLSTINVEAASKPPSRATSKDWASANAAKNALPLSRCCCCWALWRTM